MKKHILRAIALTTAALCLSGMASAGDVPTCPMVSWEEYTAASEWGWTPDGTACGMQSAGCSRWETMPESCAPAECGRCGLASCDGASCRREAACGSAAQSAGESVRPRGCRWETMPETCAPARCGQCGFSSCDGGSSCAANENCIFSFEADDGTAPEQSEQDYTAQSVSPQEIAMYNMINEDRQKNDRAMLPLDEALSAIARIKSQDMIDNDYFAHESPTYGNASDMLEDFYYEFTSVGENIAMNGSVEKAHAALMSSEGHRRNILGSQWKAVGVGVANDENGYPYVTELFVR